MKENYYVCPYCGTKHDAPAAFAHCILSCEEKKKIEEQKKRDEELAAAKESRKKEIEDAWKVYQNLIREFIKDYGRYEVTRSYVDEDGEDDAWARLFGSKTFNMFL